MVKIEFEVPMGLYRKGRVIRQLGGCHGYDELHSKSIHSEQGCTYSSVVLLHATYPCTCMDILTTIGLTDEVQ